MIALISGNAAQAGCNAYGCGVYNGYYSWGCAPEVEKSNLDRTEAALNAMSATSLAGADQFKAKVAEIAALPQKERVGAYLALAGVDASNNEAVAKFIGAREASATNVKAIAANTGISDAQAAEVLKGISAALAGELQ